MNTSFGFNLIAKNEYSLLDWIFLDKFLFITSPDNQIFQLNFMSHKIEMTLSSQTLVT